MVAPATQRRMLQAFLVSVLVGALLIAFAMKARAQEPECEGDDCYAVIYYPGICGILEPWSYWWLAFYCDLRTEGRLLALSIDYQADGSVFAVAEYEDEQGHRVRSMRHTSVPRRSIR